MFSYTIVKNNYGQGDILPAFHELLVGTSHIIVA